MDVGEVFIANLKLFESKSQISTVHQLLTLQRDTPRNFAQIEIKIQWISFLFPSNSAFLHNGWMIISDLILNGIGFREGFVLESLCVCSSSTFFKGSFYYCKRWTIIEFD